MSKYLFAEIIGPKLSDFMSRYPAIRLKINTAERTVNFEKDNVDILFAIAMPPPNKENLIQRKWKDSTRSVVCATQQYLDPKNTGIFGLFWLNLFDVALRVRFCLKIFQCILVCFCNIG